MTTPAEHWAQGLAAWALPDEVLAHATSSPWTHPVSRFAARADHAVRRPPGWSDERAGSMLPPGGSVLDIGVGAGAASLPLARRAGQLTGVDTDAAMLDAFASRAAGRGVRADTVLGGWPEVAPQVPPHDVAVIHHVVYNVPDLVPFLTAATAVARGGVVVELPPLHPMTWMNDLWELFWGITRPTTPTADDFVAVVRDLCVTGLVVYRWTREDLDPTPLDQRVALVAQRLCLPEARIPEVRAAMADRPPADHRDVVTVAWQGVAA